MNPFLKQIPILVFPPVDGLLASPQPMFTFKELEVDHNRYLLWRALIARKTPLRLTPSSKNTKN